MRSLNNVGDPTVEETSFWNDMAKDPSKTRDESFHEMTGEVGDVVFMHPFMLRTFTILRASLSKLISDFDTDTASKNLLRRARVITNPPVSLKEPFRFNRPNKDEYSLVELKTLRDLGMPDGLGDWKITGPRKEWIPNRVRKFEEMKRKELERLEKQ